ncbi:MAG: histidine kinase N-terminal 7TM domain-containing protein [Anaerolineae bacterium]
MVWQYNPYAWFPLVAMLITAALGLYALRGRAVRGARLFAISMLVASIWSAAYALQLSSANLGAAFFWLGLQMLGPVAVPLVWLAMTLQCTGLGHLLTRRFVALICIVPMLTLLMLYTGWPPGWMARDTHMVATGSVAAIRVTPGWWFWVHSAYTYGMALVTLLLLALKAVRMPPRYRTQPLVLLCGVAAMLAVHLVYLLGLLPPLPFNPTTLLATVSYMVVAWGIFRYHLFDLTPIARNHVVENMPSGVIVLDREGLVVDMNPAAQRLLGTTLSRAVGLEVDKLLSEGRALPPADEGEAARLEWLAQAGPEGASQITEVMASTLCNGRGHTMGRLITLRDISAERLAERERERLIEELRAALAEVNTLSGLLPVCAWCGKIRDDEGYWIRLDHYLAQHVHAEFTHGICPACQNELHCKASDSMGT